ncbi:MAG: hypothetical protein ABIJ37_00220 [Pseudomonadota bacterium]
MLYVERAEDGKIVALHSQPGQNVTEQKNVIDDEMLEFINSNVNTESFKLLLTMSDYSIIRVIEDILDLLIKKNIILFTELPELAREKIQERKRVRNRLVSQNVMVDDIL